MNNHILTILVWSLLSCYGLSAGAQTGTVNSGDIDNEVFAEKYHIDINDLEAEWPKVHYIGEGPLAFSFEETGSESEGHLSYTLKDWKKKTVGTGRLPKKMGPNHYDIAIENLAEKTTYQLQIKTGDRAYDLLFRKEDFPPLSNVDIRIGEGDIDCGQGSRMVYKGSFAGGRPPYSAVWNISTDRAGAESLIPMKTKIVNGAQELDELEVIGLADYYVHLDITDGCGEVQRQTAYVTCSEDRQERRMGIELSPGPTDIPTEH